VLGYPFIDIRPAESPIASQLESGKFIVLDQPINGDPIAMQILGDVMDFHDLAGRWLGSLALTRHHFTPSLQDDNFRAACAHFYGPTITSPTMLNKIE
jgi:hypothetical protein